MAKAELRLDLGPQIRQGVRDYLTRVGLTQQWAALYDDGSWTSGPHNTRAEAEEIIARSPVTPAPRLVRRWITDWQPVHEQEPTPDRCDRATGYHSTPHVGCILR